MNVVFVLIMMWSVGNAGTMTTQEFSSVKTCDAARLMALEMHRKDMNDRGYFSARCVQR